MPEETTYERGSGANPLVDAAAWLILGPALRGEPSLVLRTEPTWTLEAARALRDLISGDNADTGPRKFLSKLEDQLATAPNSVITLAASTVHGVQGDTADASVVGPGVDAAGLYVASRAGGWITSRSSSRGPTPRAASASPSRCSAGLRSLTMQDAVHAAQAEVRRAARNREAAMATGPVGNAPSLVRGIGM